VLVEIASALPREPPVQRSPTNPQSAADCLNIPIMIGQRSLDYLVLDVSKGAKMPLLVE
jgi:hypothetical protein